MIYPIRKILYEYRLLKLSRRKLEEFYSSDDREGLWLAINYGIGYYQRQLIHLLGELANIKDYSLLMEEHIWDIHRNGGLY